MKHFKEFKIVFLLILISLISACKKDTLVKDIPDGIVNYIVEDNLEIAKFEIETYPLVDGKNITFIPENWDYDYEYSWSFGNGDTSNYLSPSYTYDSVGVYTVSLTITNDFVTITETKDITINSSEGTLTDIEGNIYKTKIIGEQTWMIENLKTTKFNDGTEIPYINVDSLWEPAKHPTHCWLDNDENNKEPYGGMYNYYAVETSKLCPVDWHVPSKEEWVDLLYYISDDKDERAEYFLEDLSLTLAGYRFYSTFSDVDENGFYWSSTEEDYNYYRANTLSLYQSSEWVTSSVDRSFNYGLSVLCLKDSTF